MLIVADGFSLTAHWRRWEGAMVVRLLLAAVVGIIAGSAVISTIDEPTLRKVIAVATGLFVVGYGALRRIELPARRIDRLGIVAGATAGFTSTLAHLGGPPIVAYLMSTRLAPRPLVATSVAFFAAINLLKLPGYAFAGLFDGGLIAATVWAWLLIPVGVVAGRTLVERIDRRSFDLVMLALLTVGAAVLFST